jgi:hypothetical protein
MANKERQQRLGMLRLREAEGMLTKPERAGVFTHALTMSCGFLFQPTCDLRWQVDRKGHESLLRPSILPAPFAGEGRLARVPALRQPSRGQAATRDP